jgi:large subunit ribosomal protein L25
MLKATQRKPGTRQAKKLRLQGLIPASVQGGGRPNVDLAIEERALLAARRHHEHLFDIEVEGSGTETVLVRELQWDTTVERILHVEFRRVVRGEKTEVEVELAFEGHPKGGVTNHLITHVTIRALPSEIPDELVVPMGETHPGDVLHLRDVRLPEGVELVTDPETPIASVAVPRGIDEDLPAEGEEGAEPAAGTSPSAEGESE